MFELKLNSDKLVSTINLRKLINEIRIKFKEPEIRNNQFIDRVVDEIDDLGVCKTFVNAKGAPPSKYYNLTLEQALYVGMRESKGVRREVVSIIKKLQDEIRELTAPRNYIEALEALIVKEKEKQLALEQRDEAIQTKAWISDKKTATAMNTASQFSKENSKLKIALDESLKYATIKKVQMVTGKKYRWKPLKDYSIEHNLDIKRVPDANYGEISAYHADAWIDCFNVDITEFK